MDVSFLKWLITAGGMFCLRARR